MVWKVVNISDTGTASKFGANDMDKVSNAFSGIDVDDFDINCDFKIRSGKFQQRNPANTFSYVHTPAAITADRVVNWPLLTAGDTVTMNAFAATLTNKTIDVRDNPVITRENTYLIFKDGSTYYSRNGTTGALNSNTNFRTLIMAIIDALPTRDDTVFTKIKIAPGTYEVNTNAISISDVYNLHIEGSGRGITRILAGASLPSGEEVIRCSGNVSGTSKSLTTNCALNSKTAVMSSGDASTFAIGDQVLLRSNVDFGAGGSASGHQGELKIISNISSGTITFTEPTFDSYTTANGASMIKILPCKNITLKDLTVDQHASYAVEANDGWVTFDFCNKVLVDKVEVKDFPGQFGGYLVFRSCWGVEVSDCHLQQDIAYNFQYGYTFEQASQDCVITNCTARGDMRHAYEAGDGRTGTNEEGVCRNILFTGCTASGGSQNPFDTHPEGEGISFVNCGILGTNVVGGFKIRSHSSSVKDCYAQGVQATGGSGANSVIQVDDFAENCVISGNNIFNCLGDGIKISDGSEGTIISNNHINNITGVGINMRSGSGKAIVSGNMIRSCGSDGINCINIDDTVFSGNRIAGNGAFGLRFEAGTCTNNIVHGNWFGTNTSGNVSNGGQSGNVEGQNKGYP